MGAHGRTKGRHIHHHDPLPKGSACATCKARKVRCSGQKPACDACKRTARFEGRDPDAVVCSYGGKACGPRQPPPPREGRHSQPRSSSAGRSLSPASGAASPSTSAIAEPESAATHLDDSSAPHSSLRSSRWPSFDSSSDADSSGASSPSTVLHTPSDHAFLQHAFPVAAAEASGSSSSSVGAPAAPVSIATDESFADFADAFWRDFASSGALAPQQPGFHDDSLFGKLAQQHSQPAPLALSMSRDSSSSSSPSASSASPSSPASSAVSSSSAATSPSQQRLHSPHAYERMIGATSVASSSGSFFAPSSLTSSSSSSSSSAGAMMMPQQPRTYGSATSQGKAPQPSFIALPPAAPSSMFPVGATTPGWAYAASTAPLFGTPAPLVSPAPTAAQIDSYFWGSDWTAASASTSSLAPTPTSTGNPYHVPAPALINNASCATDSFAFDVPFDFAADVLTYQV